MKKIGKWARKWSFMIVLLVMGILYFTYTDSWIVYAKPIRQAGAWLGMQGKEQEHNSGNVSSGNVSSGNAGEPTASANDLQGAVSVSGGEPAGVNVSGNNQNDMVSMDAALSDTTLVKPTATPELSLNPPSSEASPTEAPSAETLPAETPSGAYGNPEDVVYVSVEDDYFADALFIGDSRTVGLYEYGGLEETATFYASTGLTIYKMFTAEIVEVPGQKQKLTLEEALAEKQFSKIYLMIGINEMGTGTVETFIEKYREAVEHLQELQPHAMIYLQGIMKVTAERSKQGDYIHNEGIEARNAEIAKLADNVNIYYLDVNPLICDETGGMIETYTFDGVHLKAQYTSIWKDYLKGNAVKKVILD